MAVISAVVLTVTLLIPAFQASAASVKLNRTKIVLAVGQTYALKLSGTKKTVKWATSNKKVAIVSRKGVVKAVGKGKAVITAKVGKKTYKCAVGVDAPKLSATKKTVTAGTSFALKLYGTKRTVKWYTSNKKIATVSQKGVVKTLRAGTVKITAKVGGKAYVCTVTVKAKTNNTAQINAAAATRYNALINNLKKEKNVTIKKAVALNMKLTEYPKILDTIAKDELKEMKEGIKENSSETLVFTNGKAPLGGEKFMTLNEFVPPESKTAALKANYIKTAKTVKTSDGGYKLTIVLKPESSKFDGKKFSATPGNASVSETLSSFDMGMDGVEGIEMKLSLTGTVIEATANAKGKLTKLSIKAPMSMDMNMFIFNIVMSGSNTQTLNVTYR